MAETARSKAGRKRKLTDSEREKNKKALWANYACKRICIGDQHERWNKLKSTLNVKTNPEVAKFLLDSYELKNGSAKKTSKTRRNVTEDRATTTTPGPAIRGMQSNAMSNITTSETESMDMVMSGVEKHKESVKLESPTVLSTSLKESVKMESPTVLSTSLKESVKLESPTVLSTSLKESVKLESPAILSTSLKESVKMESPTVLSTSLSNTNNNNCDIYIKREYLCKYTKKQPL